MNKYKLNIQISGRSDNGLTVVITEIDSDGSQEITRMPAIEEFALRYHNLNLNIPAKELDEEIYEN